jgi:hypothetical protein
MHAGAMLMCLLALGSRVCVAAAAATTEDATSVRQPQDFPCFTGRGPGTVEQHGRSQGAESPGEASGGGGMPSSNVWNGDPRTQSCGTVTLARRLQVWRGCGSWQTSARTAWLA